MAKNEHELQNEIRLELSKLGFTVFRTNVGKVRLADGRFFDTGLPKGFSDLIAIKEGKVYFVEVKFGKGKLRPDQKNFIEQMQKKGCVAGAVWSVEEAVELVGG